MKAFTLPGGLQGPPSACSCAENRVDVFATGAGNMVWRWSLTGNTWSPPVPLLLGPVSIPAEGVCAVASGPGRVEVFAVDRNSGVPAWWRGVDALWLPPAILTPGPNLPAEPVAAVAASPDNIDVFAAGPRNQPWWWHWDGANWSPPISLPGGGLPAERIAVASPAPGRLDVFAAGAGNHLWHWRKVGAAPWGPAEDLGGNLPAEGVSAVSWGPNRLDVFGASRAPGNPVQHWWWDGGGFAMDELPGLYPRLADNGVAPGTVSAVSHAPDRLDVFGITGDQRIAHWQWDGASWNGPSHYGDGIPAGDLSAVVRVRGSLQPRLPARRHLDVFATGVGGTLLQWPGGGLENAHTQSWTNWPTNQVKNPAVLVRPDSLDELVNVVTEAEKNGLGVRAVGSSWSNSDVAVSPGYIVETDKLDGVLTEVLSGCLNNAAVGRKLIHVEAGIKLWQLNDLLDHKQLALHTMGGSSGQSLAGVLSTSACGMDVDRGPIPDTVRAIHLVGPGGVQHWIEPSAGITNRDAVAAVLNLPAENVHYDDDWFNSALVGVGSLGIIYSAIVEVDAQYDLVNQCDALDWNAVKAGLKGGAGNPFPGNRGVQVVIEPYGGASHVCYLTTRTEARPPTVAGGGDIPPWLVTAFSPALVNGFRANPATIPAGVSKLTRLQQLGPQLDNRRRTQGWGHTIMGGPDPGGQRGLTVAVIFDATAPNTGYLDFIDSALGIIQAALNEPHPLAPLGYLGWVSLRFQAGSRAYLSPQHSADPENRRSAMFEFAAFWRVPEIGLTWEGTPILIDRIEAEARRFGGILHWGLNNTVNATDVVRAYPRLDAWRRVRWELTKSGTIHTFDSDFTRRCGLSDPPMPTLSGDYDHDGKADFAVWRPGSQTWFIIDSSTGVQRTQQLGQPGDIPVPGDYDGDGQTDLAVWNPYTATWRVIDSSTGNQRQPQQWGQIGDIPVPGDYDGDGRTDYAVWRPGTGEWFVIDSSTGKPRPAAQQWGQAGDIPVPGDYDADGKTDFAVWRPSDGVWYVIASSTGQTRAVQWGQPGDIPVPGRYNTAKRTDFAVWRPSDGTWHVLDSSTLTDRTQQWGQRGDIPV